MEILRGVTSGGERQRFGRSLASCLVAVALILGLGVAGSAGAATSALYQQGGTIEIGQNSNENAQGNSSDQGSGQDVGMNGGSSANNQEQSSAQENLNDNDQNIGVDGSGNGGDGASTTETEEQDALASSVSDSMVATILGILSALLAGG